MTRDFDGKVETEDQTPLPGWACTAIGIGFIVLLTAAIVAVRILAG